MCPVSGLIRLTVRVTSSARRRNCSPVINMKQKMAILHDVENTIGKEKRSYRRHPKNRRAALSSHVQGILPLFTVLLLQKMLGSVSISSLTLRLMFSHVRSCNVGHCEGVVSAVIYLLRFKYVNGINICCFKKKLIEIVCFIDT